MKPGAVANGVILENGWEQIREEYAHQGYLDAQVEPLAEFDEQAHTVSYVVTIREGHPYKMGKLVVTGLSPTAERRLRAAFPDLSGEIFDKQKFEDILSKLEVHHEQIFVDLPVHYETVGHWLQRDESAGTVDVLLDFK